MLRLFVKSNPRQASARRCSLLGDSFCCYIVAWLISHLFVKWGYLTRVPTLREIGNGEVGPLLTSSVGQSPSSPVPSRPDRVTSQWSPIQQLTLQLAASVDNRGSDVRLVSGELLQPHRISRQSVDARLWRWRVAFFWEWTRAEHINVLELRAMRSEWVASIRSQQ